MERVARSIGTRQTGRGRTTLTLGFLAILILSSMAVGLTSAAPAAAPAPHGESLSRPVLTSAGDPRALPRGGTAKGGGSGGPTCPSSSNPCYLQEGAEFLNFNNSPDPTNLILTSLSENFTFVPLGTVLSPSGGSELETEYELNGVTSTGDWVQMAVGDNWPLGYNVCSIPTFNLNFEVWNNAAVSEIGPYWVASGFPVCSQAFVPAIGDQLGLSMALDCPASDASDGSAVCLTFSDFTQGKSTTTVYNSMPDLGATGFVTKAVFDGANGYFVGPATETVWNGGGGCPTLSLPTVNYTLRAIGGPSNDPVFPLVVTSYQPWSDEFNTSNDRPNLDCYGISTGSQALTSSPDTSFTEASGGSTFGPHWISAQNWTAAELLLGVNAPGVSRFETDPPQPTPWSTSTFVLGSGVISGLAAIDSGQSYTGSSVTSGPSVHCFWEIDGTPYTPGLPDSCELAGTGYSTGIFTISSLDMDSNGDVETSSSTLWVLSAPVAALTLRPNSVIAPLEEDVSPLSVSTTAYGGQSPYSYVWNGFPSAWQCQYAVPHFECIPTTSGTFSVSISVTDALGDTSTSQPLTVAVYDPCTREPLSCYRVVFRGETAASADWGAGLGVYCAICSFVEALTPSNASEPPVYEYLVPNGSYQYVLTGPANESVLTAPVGNLTVNGSNWERNVSFGPVVRSAVDLTVEGLPRGTSWCVRLVVLRCAEADTMSPAEVAADAVSVKGLTPGVYPYELLPVPGYTATLKIGGRPAPAEGWIEVTKHGARLSAAFAEVSYPWTVYETGLPSGRAWGVRISGLFDGRTKTESRSTRDASLTVQLPNGTFNLSLLRDKGYFSYAATNFTVRASSGNLSVWFLPVPPRRFPSGDPLTPASTAPQVPAGTAVPTSPAARPLPGLAALPGGLLLLLARRPRGRR